MLVPELERLLAAASPMGEDVELVTWRDGSDPYEAAASLLAGATRIAVADRLWASHLLGLQQVLPAAAFSPASPILGRLRSVKDPDELDALRRAARAADETFRQILGMPFQGRSEEAVAHDLAELLVENGHAKAAFTIVARRERRLSAPRTGRPNGPPRDARRDGLRRGARRLPQRHDPHRGGSGAAGGFEAAYEAVREAQAAGVEAVRPGLEAGEIDRRTRAVIEAGLRRALHPPYGPRDRPRDPRVALPREERSSGPPSPG